MSFNPLVKGSDTLLVSAPSLESSLPRPDALLSEALSASPGSDGGIQQTGDNKSHNNNHNNSHNNNHIQEQVEMASARTKVRPVSSAKRRGVHVSCKYAECSRLAVRGGLPGLCISHGGGRRCSYHNCNKTTQGATTLCISHGGGNRCQFLGCSRAVRGGVGFCGQHGTPVDTAAVASSKNNARGRASLGVFDLALKHAIEIDLSGNGPVVRCADIMRIWSNELVKTKEQEEKEEEERLQQEEKEEEERLQQEEKEEEERLQEEEEMEVDCTTQVVDDDEEDESLVDVTEGMVRLVDSSTDESSVDITEGMTRLDNGEGEDSDNNAGSAVGKQGGAGEKEMGIWSLDCTSMCHS